MWEYRGQHRPTFAEDPGSECESVWDYPRPPRIETDARRVLVRDGTRVLADSHRALRVLETASPPTFYLPAADVTFHHLVPLAVRSVCEWKGAARYWTLSRSANGEAVAWEYPLPSPPFEAIAAHVAFYPGRVECQVNGERVRPQPGGFYGGWVTDEVAGPFKGAPGTGHW